MSGSEICWQGKYILQKNNCFIKSSHLQYSDHSQPLDFFKKEERNMIFLSLVTMSPLCYCLQIVKRKGKKEKNNIPKQYI